MKLSNRMSCTVDVVDNNDSHWQSNEKDSLQIEISSTVMLALLKDNNISMCYCRGLNQKTRMRLRRLLESVYI